MQPFGNLFSDKLTEWCHEKPRGDVYRTRGSKEGRTGYKPKQQQQLRTRTCCRRRSPREGLCGWCEEQHGASLWAGVNLTSPYLLFPTLVAGPFTGNSTQESSSGFHNWMDSEDLGMGLSMTSKFRPEDAARQPPSTVHRAVFHLDPPSLSSPFLLREGKDLSPPVSMSIGVFQVGSLPLITERLSLWLHVPLPVFLAETPIHLISFTGLRKLP